jgi:hypothetical protein
MTLIARELNNVGASTLEAFRRWRSRSQHRRPQGVDENLLPERRV